MQKSLILKKELNIFHKFPHGTIYYRILNFTYIKRWFSPFRIFINLSTKKKIINIFIKNFLNFYKKNKKIYSFLYKNKEVRSPLLTFNSFD